MSYTPAPGSIWSTPVGDCDGNRQYHGTSRQSHDTRQDWRPEQHSAPPATSATPMPFSYSANSQQYQSHPSMSASQPSSHPPTSPAVFPRSPGLGSQRERLPSYAPVPSSPVEDSYPSHDYRHHYAPTPHYGGAHPSYSPRHSSSSSASSPGPLPALTASTPSYQPLPHTGATVQETRYSHASLCPAASAAGAVDHHHQPQASMSSVLKLQARLQAIASKSSRKSSGLPDVTPEVITQVASCLADETVFEIFREVEEIQQITERNLLNDRMRVLNRHKTQRIALAKEQKAAFQKYESMPHRLPQLKTTFQQKKEVLEKKLDEEIRQLDQKIILQLDQQVSEQQSTLQQVGVPCFFFTNNPDELGLQMAIISLVKKLREQVAAS